MAVKYKMSQARRSKSTKFEAPNVVLLEEI